MSTTSAHSPVLARALLVVALGPALGAQVVFAPPEQLLPPLPQDSLPGGVLAGDFDGDGHQDLLTSRGLFPAQTALLLGAGDGTLAPGGAAPANLRPLFVAADVGGDGHLDVLAQQGAALSLFHGRGDGTFEPPQVLDTIGNHDFAAAGDLDGDGRPDLAVSTSLLSSVTVDIWLQQDDGGFAIGPSVSVSSSLFTPILSLSLEDFDHDGALDLLTGLGDGTMRSHTGQGDGTFTFAGSATVVPGVGLLDPGLTLLARDLDLDGEFDLLGTSPLDATPYVRWGQPGWTFGGILTLPPLPGAPKGITAADWDGDGLLDVGVSSLPADGATAGSLHVLQQTSPRTFAAPLHVTGGGPLVQPVTPDLDEDGLPDLAAFLNTSDDSTATIAALANATYGPGEPFTDLGGSTPGTTGWPVLLCKGTLTPWSAYGFTLAGAPADALPILVIGDAPLEQPLLGGLLWPQPQRLLAMPAVGPDGRSAFEGPWPAGLAGVELWLQVWFADAGAPAGWASTTGVAAQAP